MRSPPSEAEPLLSLPPDHFELFSVDLLVEEEVDAVLEADGLLQAV